VIYGKGKKQRIKRDCLVNEQDKITHKDLCLATAKRFIDRVALYEYKSFVCNEQPDVLIYGEFKTTLFEIKMSLSDFNADKYKDCRKKYRVPLWAKHLPSLEASEGKKQKVKLEFENGDIEIELIEKEHLGNYRYFVCPYGLIPVDKVPEGWGLYYYKNGRFFIKKKSGYFRSNLKHENAYIVHALRRYASGDSTGIMINTYDFIDRKKK